MRQTVERLPSPVHGKEKNCNSWGEYEHPGSSSSANLCNGGMYEGDFYEPCPARWECAHVTRGQSRSLPTYQEKPFGGSSVVSRTPSAGPGLRGWDPWKPTRPSIPTTIPTITRNQQAAIPDGGPGPHPVVPPGDWPRHMTTPYVGFSPVGVGVTPTFLPDEEEGVFARLGKNILQGWLGSTGWHIFDYSRSVDLFRKRG